MRRRALAGEVRRQQPEHVLEPPALLAIGLRLRTRAVLRPTPRERKGNSGVLAALLNSYP